MGILFRSVTGKGISFKSLFQLIQHDTYIVLYEVLKESRYLDLDKQMIKVAVAGCSPISITLGKDATQLAFHMHSNSFF